MDVLLLGAEHLETDVQQQHSAVILSDYLSALQTLQSNHTDNTSTTLCEQLNKLSKIKGNSSSIELISFRNEGKPNYRPGSKRRK